LLSAAFVAVNEHVPLASVTLTVVPETEQPVEAPELNETSPVPVPPDELAVPVDPYVTELGPVTVRVACVALFSVTVKGALGADTSKLLSAARVAVNVQVPLASLTLTVVPLTLQPVEAPESKLYAPVPLPPVAVAVPVEPYVTLVGPVAVTVPWVPLTKVTENGALVAEV